MTERPSERAKRERIERLWPPAKPKAKRRGYNRKAVEQPAEPIPDEADVFDPHATDEPEGGYMQTPLDTPA